MNPGYTHCPACLDVIFVDDNTTTTYCDGCIRKGWATKHRQNREKPQPAGDVVDNMVALMAARRLARKAE